MIDVVNLAIFKLENSQQKLKKINHLVKIDFDDGGRTVNFKFIF